MPDHLGPPQVEKLRQDGWTESEKRMGNGNPSVSTKVLLGDDRFTAAVLRVGGGKRLEGLDHLLSLLLFFPLSPSLFSFSSLFFVYLMLSVISVFFVFWCTSRTFPPATSTEIYKITTQKVGVVVTRQSKRQAIDNPRYRPTGSIPSHGGLGASPPPHM